MLKKYIRFSVILITLFSFCLYNVKAYDYIKDENESRVNQLLIEIYDSKEQYEDLAGDYEETTVKVFNANNASYWWPIGSAETVEVGDKVYAKDAPYPTYVTSKFGYREDPLGRGTRFHSGTDISGSNALGNIKTFFSLLYFLYNHTHTI